MLGPTRPARSRCPTTAPSPATFRVGLRGAHRCHLAPSGEVAAGRAIDGADVDRDGLRGDRAGASATRRPARSSPADASPACSTRRPRSTDDGQPVITLAGRHRAARPRRGDRRRPQRAGWAGRSRLVEAAGAPRRPGRVLRRRHRRHERRRSSGRCRRAVRRRACRCSCSRRPASAPRPRCTPTAIGTSAASGPTCSSTSTATAGSRTAGAAAGPRRRRSSSRPQQPCVAAPWSPAPSPSSTRDLDIYRTVARHHAGTFGVWTTVLTPGTVRAGDPVELLG